MTKVEEPSFEAARDELQRIVAQLESGGLPLAESLALWERAEVLADIAQRWLDGARTRMAELRPSTEPAQDSPSEG
ncbi:MAG: exodeoxyribonuclease VII small subunit [Actinomycetes bacterium]